MKGGTMEIEMKFSLIEKEIAELKYRIDVLEDKIKPSMTQQIPQRDREGNIVRR